MGNNRVPCAIINFYYGDSRGKLCPSVDNILVTMGPKQGMMANFSLSGPNMLFYTENMGTESVPFLSYFFLMGRGA